MLNRIKSGIFLLAIFLLLIIIQSCSMTSEKNPIQFNNSTPPGALRILSTIQSADKIIIEWSQPSESDFGYVRITWSPGGSTGVRVDKGINTYTLQGLSSAVDYIITLTSVDTDGYQSSPVKVNKSRDITRPNNINIRSRSETSDYTAITFNWDAPVDTDFHHVEVEWTNAAGVAVKETVPEGTNSITITGLSKLINYTFSFTGVDDAGNRSATPATEIKYKDTTPPLKVTDVNITDYYTSIYLNWTNPADGDFHHIRLTWNNQSAVLSPGANSYTIPGTSSSLDYAIKIYSVDDAGNESSPYETQRTRDVTVPGAVTNIDADTSRLHKVSISWDDPSDADLKHILVTWKIGAAVAGTQVVAKGAESFSLSTLDSRETYTFIITAVDYAGNTADANPITKLKDTTPPGKVRNELRETHLHEIRITWDDPEEPAELDERDFKRVKITWSEGGTVIGTDYVNKNVLSFTKTGLDSAKEYTFRLYSVDEDGNESLPVEVLKNKDITAPGTVMDAQASTTADGTGISITWADPVDPVDPADSRDRDFDHVKITWVDETGTITGSSVKPKGACSFSITGLDGSKKYTFKLISVDEDGNESAAVAVIKYRETIPPAQVRMSSVLGGEGTVNFNWFDPTDADFDHVEITISPVTAGITQLNLVNPGVQTFTTTPALLDHIIYTFRIVAVDIAGNASTPVTFSLTPYNNTGGIKGIYMIYTAEDLYNVRNDLEGDYIVMANIDLSDYAPGALGGAIGWIPIGSNSTPFKGTFDGNGFTISNLTIDNSPALYQALFGAVTKVFAPSGTIKNVTISGCNVKGGGSSSCLVGQQSGGVISNCHVTGIITSSGTYAGGLVANAANSPIIENCSAAVDITGTSMGAGGLIGGLSGNSAKVTNCYATGNITTTAYIGGLIGFLGSTNTVVVENCYATGNVTGRQNAGGFAGQLGTSASISNCYATGDVTRSGTSTSTTFGGFAGYGTALSLTSSYYCGTLSAGLVDNASGTRKPGNAMKLVDTYTDWNFSAIWAIDAAINGGYPYLRSNLPR